MSWSNPYTTTALQPELNDAQFAFFRELAGRHAGIGLTDIKRNMVYRRILRRLNALKIESFEEYRRLIIGDGGACELENFVNALTTNKTEFFRESHHFSHLTNKALPELLAKHGPKGQQSLRLWSAGCSSGEEAYSIAMAVREGTQSRQGWDIKILATDIDTEMIALAQIGEYTIDDVAPIPDELRRRFCDALPGKAGRVGMAKSLRELITFNQLNLHAPWPMQRKYDVIFCRNVVIYFDKPAQISLFDRFANLLNDGGFLYVGHSESLYKVTDRFIPLGQSIHRKVV